MQMKYRKIDGKNPRIAFDKDQIRKTIKSIDRHDPNQRFLILFLEQMQDVVLGN